MPNIVAISGPTTTLRIENTDDSYNMNAYVMGLDPDSSSPMFLVSNPVGTVYMASPADVPAIGTAIPAPVAFAIPPMNCINISIPYMSSGRIYFVYQNTLNFTMNPGSGGGMPMICQPSGTSASTDLAADYNKLWSFCEFTFTEAQLYANISYVDFIALPVAMKVQGAASGGPSQVLGVPPDGIRYIAKCLGDQADADGQGWRNLVIWHPSSPSHDPTDPNAIILRIIAPTYEPSFNNYLDTYIQGIWDYYRSYKLTIASTGGTYSGLSDGTNLNLSGIGAVPMPSTSEVWHSKGGIFDTPVGSIVGAALNRATLSFTQTVNGQKKAVQLDDNQATDENLANFYQQFIANHYARIVHATNYDTRGYCHPYDDVTAPHVPDQSGCVLNPSPQVWTVTIGGPLSTEYSQRRMKSRKKQRAMSWNRGQQPAPSKFKRDLSNGGDLLNGIARMMSDRGDQGPGCPIPEPLQDEEEIEEDKLLKIQPIKPVHKVETQLDVKKCPLVTVEEVDGAEDRDIEKGEYTDHDAMTMSKSFGSKIRPAVSQLSRQMVSKFRSSPIWTSRLQPIFTVINSFLLSFLSLSIRAVLSRIFIFVLVTLMWMFGGGSLPLGQSSSSSAGVEETQKSVLETMIALNNTLSALQV